MSKMTTIQVEIGCPSGSTTWRNGSVNVTVSEGFEYDFVQAIIHHARIFAKQYTLEEDQ